MSDRWDNVLHYAWRSSCAVVVNPVDGKMIALAPDVWSNALASESRVVFWSELQGKERRP